MDVKKTRNKIKLPLHLKKKEIVHQFCWPFIKRDHRNGDYYYFLGDRRQNDKQLHSNQNDIKEIVYFIVFQSYSTPTKQ